MRDSTHPVEGESSQKDFNVIYFNARSLLPKLDELRTLVEMEKPSIVCVVETWLSEDITDEEISISNYQIFCCNRNRHGGGVLIYTHISLSVSVLLSGPDKLELLSILLSSPCSSNKHCQERMSRRRRRRSMQLPYTRECHPNPYSILITFLIWKLKTNLYVN